jgi:hypothetical protein
MLLGENKFAMNDEEFKAGNAGELLHLIGRMIDNKAQPTVAQSGV